MGDGGWGAEVEERLRGRRMEKMTRGPFIELIRPVRAACFSSPRPMKYLRTEQLPMDPAMVNCPQYGGL